MRKEYKSMVMRFLLVTLLCGLVLGISQTVSAQTAAAPAAPAPSVVWRLDYYLPNYDPETIMLQQAADDILKYTTYANKGGLKIEIYPAGSLKLPDTKQSNVRDGLCEMVVGEPEEEEAFGVTNAAAIWPSKLNQALAAEALKPMKQKIWAEKWNSQYIASKMMGAHLNGIFTTKKKLNSTADLKGLKLRTTSLDQKTGMLKFGASPTPMPPGEVYMALKTGVIDGACSGSRILLYQKLGEVVKYAVETTLTDGIVQDIVVNKKAWNAIPKPWQEIVTEVFLGLEGRQRAAAVNPGIGNYYKEYNKSMGVEYTEWSAADKKNYDKVFADLYLADLNKKLKEDKNLAEAWKIAKPFTLVK
jgi:TRAP-type C4-dicarboxylate transport system substrate-binding protein